MKKELTEKVNFDLIRYANCWEDADVLLKGLKVEAGSKVLSIGSAGDNSFSLLSANPDLVVAVDVNKIQLYLIELKKVCFEQLTREEMISFLGFRESNVRRETFLKLKTYLGEEARRYWEAHLQQIEKGIISQGKFENYFQLFSQRIMPWIHSDEMTEELLHSKCATSQKALYKNKWNTFKWKSLFKIFFSKYVMGKYGRDPEFLKEVKVPVGSFIFEKAARHLQSVEAQNNFMLRYQLTGSFGDLLPHYLQAENFERIKSNIHKLEIVEGYAEEGVRQFGQFNYMNLSNIFEYMDKKLFAHTAKKLIESMAPGGILAYWNLMVPRRMSSLFPEKLNFQKHASEALGIEDKGFFYKQFILEQIK